MNIQPDPPQNEIAAMIWKAKMDGLKMTWKMMLLGNPNMDGLKDDAS